MTWILVLALGLGALALLLGAFRGTRVNWQAPAAALLLGLTGYAMQGQPGQPGAPHLHVEQAMADPGGEIRSRQMLAGRDDQNDFSMTIANAMIRHGQFADAATVLNGEVEKHPHNGQAWLAMANALVGQAQGSLSPAALLAYRRAAEADPAAPGPPFFLGLALARAGRLAETRAIWAGLLARARADAPWRPDLARRVEMLDALASGRMPAAPPGSAPSAAPGP
jgi:cytochrome c-type biogenesis protein CcmH